MEKKDEINVVIEEKYHQSDAEKSFLKGVVGYSVQCAMCNVHTPVIIERSQVGSQDEMPAAQEKKIFRRL